MDQAACLSPLSRELSAVPKNAMMALAAQYTDVISLGRGDPDLPTPDHIIAAGQKALAEGATHYTTIPGIPELRQAIAHRLSAVHGVSVDPEAGMIITVGCQEAIMLAGLTLFSPGDEVIVGDPRYTTYDVAIRMAGAKLVPVRRRAEEEFRWAPEDIAAALTPRTRAIVLVSPDNPTGNITVREDLEAIAALARERNLVVISDEIYERVTFGKHPHLSIAALPGMAERTLLISGFSKAYCMTGWRVGFVAGPPTWIKGMHTIKHSLSISTPTASQYAAYAALTGPQGPIEQIRDTYDERRQILTAAFRAVGLDCPDIHGGTFLFVDVRRSGMTSDAFARTLLHEARVLVYPGDQFGEGGVGWLRVSLFAPTDRVKEAAERIRQTVPRMLATV